MLNASLALLSGVETIPWERQPYPHESLVLRIFSGDNLIISILVEQTPSKNPYTDWSLWTKQLRRHKQQEAKYLDQYLEAIWPLV